LQNSLLRLHRALAEVHPSTVREFFQLATLQFRRELIDLARHYFGPEGLGANYASTAGRSTNHGGPVDRAASGESIGSDDLAMWTELHDRIQSLPDESRETFELLFYHGLSQKEAADLLNVSTQTIQRRWTEACEQLRRGKSDSLSG
jgi:RNA polymerase sigma factor (sigma-70 family)